MRNQELSPNGVHLAGDMQVYAGYPENWDATSTLLHQEGESDIYSIVLDIPAFQKYEYKFINGDQFYEAEFVPVLSRVGYDFNDNRWVFIDSLTNDTTDIGAVLFGENAPVGQNAIRFLVDMSEQVIQNQVFVLGEFNSWNFSGNAMFSFENNLYESIQFLEPGEQYYRFSNGYENGEEDVSGDCAEEGSRFIRVENDSALSQVCFASCALCTTSGIQRNPEKTNSRLGPNPSKGQTCLFLDKGTHSIRVSDLSGRVLLTKEGYSEPVLNLDQFSQGTYLINIRYASGLMETLKMIVH